MKCRVDFALIENACPICELSAVGETVEGAIAAAMIAAAPHLADGRGVVVIRAGYLCRCGCYHPMSEAVESCQHAEPDEEEAPEELAN